MTKTRSHARRVAQDNHNYGDDFRDAAGKVTEGVRDLANTAGSAARAQVDPVTEYVRKNPMQSMLLAAGAGAILGLLFLRR